MVNYLTPRPIDMLVVSGDLRSACLANMIGAVKDMSVVAQNNIPVMSGNLPVYRGRPSQPITHAYVDDFLLETLAGLGPWYIADMRELTAPRISLRDEHERKRTVPLSRAVVALVRGIRDGKLAGGVVTPVSLFHLQEQLPPVRFKNRNAFDCQANNLIVGTQSLLGGTFHRPMLVDPLDIRPVDLSPMSAAPLVNIDDVPELHENQYEERSFDPLAATEFTAKSETIASVRRILAGGDDTSP